MKQRSEMNKSLTIDVNDLQKQQEQFYEMQKEIVLKNKRISPEAKVTLLNQLENALNGVYYK